MPAKRTLKRDTLTPITDALIDDMLCGNGIPRCDEWDRLVRHTKSLETSFYRVNRQIDRLEIERDAFKETLRTFADRVEQLAFRMPSPNVFTPEFVQLSQKSRVVIAHAQSQAGGGEGNEA